MVGIIFENARVFNGYSEECPEGMSVFVEGGEIREVSASQVVSSSARRIDCQGKTLMPGLIDLHIHACISDLDAQKNDRMGEAYRIAHAARMLNYSLDCGFTTVRDIGGADWSLGQAIASGLIRSPRFFYAGKVISMTGGHGDLRSAGQSEHTHGYCSCGSMNSVAVIADGVDDCIKAAREELRQGAHCIKIMASGGIASPTDPLWMSQYRADEIKAIVNECVERRTYVSAHCHPISAIRRCVEYGVRVIEHATLVDSATSEYVAEQGAYVVPTLVGISAVADIGPDIGLSPSIVEKGRIVIAGAMEGLDAMRQAGVKVGFGTDLLGQVYRRQCDEFTLRREVFSPIELLRQATSMSAEILMQEDRLGCIAPGAHADLLIVDGDPVSDIGLLIDSGKRLSLIMRGGEIVKESLH